MPKNKLGLYWVKLNSSWDCTLLQLICIRYYLLTIHVQFQDRNILSRLGRGLTGILDLSQFLIELVLNWPTGTELGNFALHAIKIRLKMFETWAKTFQLAKEFLGHQLLILHQFGKPDLLSTPSKSDLNRNIIAYHGIFGRIAGGQLLSQQTQFI